MNDSTVFGLYYELLLWSVNTIIIFQFWKKATLGKSDFPICIFGEHTEAQCMSDKLQSMGQILKEVKSLCCKNGAYQQN